MTNPCSRHQHVPRLVQQPLSELTDKLRKQARKITGPRQAVLDVLRRHNHPLTNREIHEALGKSDCDLATIYRNMHTLEAMGLVKRFDFGDGVARFELVVDGDDAHHHHLICTRCSIVIELDQCFAADLETRVAQRHGFTNIRHTLEFFGLCPKCSAQTKPQP